MKIQHLLSTMLVAAALVVTLPRLAHAWSHPEIDAAVGTTLRADGEPSEGGATGVFSAMWPFASRARFGVSGFADDIGSRTGHLYDPNNGTDLGMAAFAHRWVWGGAWRTDVDVIRFGRWTATGVGTWGWSRVEDDVRGRPLSAASAVGLSLGGEVRRTIAPGQSLGVIVRSHRLFAERNAAYRRTNHYITAAVEWGWAGAPRP